MSAKHAKKPQGFLEQSGPFAASGDSMFLYVLQSRAAVKVGVARDVLKRAKTLQAGCPSEIKPVLAVGPFDKKLARSIEHEIHISMKKRRAQGEWFSCSVESAVTMVASYCAIYMFVDFHVFGGPHRKTVNECIERQNLSRRRPDEEKTSEARERISKILSVFSAVRKEAIG